MSKGAKQPNKTGMRCLICYAYEFLDVKTGTVKIEHENFCPDRTR